MTATNVAERFGIGRVKGRIADGFDADLTLVDLQGTVTITAEQLFYRHAISPYVGSELRAVVKGTWVRGRAVYRNGKFPGQAAGRLLTRIKTPGENSVSNSVFSCAVRRLFRNLSRNFFGSCRDARALILS